MNLLWQYLKNYKKLLAFSLVLATVNQIFSLLDPLIFRHIVDDYATKVGQIPHDKFLRGVILLLLLTMATAFVSRVAKNFQDYYVNVVVQRLGAKMYNHSIEHSFSLPFALFEDQRSGEVLNKLQKARDDSQKLILSSINTLFLSVVGVTFVLTYAFLAYWLMGVVYFLIIPTLGFATFFISKKIKSIQSRIIKETSSLAGSTTETLRNVELVKSLGLEAQEISRLNKVNEQILALELAKVKMVRKLSFLQGTLVNALRSALLLIMLWAVFSGEITLGQFFSLMFYSFFVFAPLAELGNVATSYQETKASMARLDEILNTPKEIVPENAVVLDSVSSLSFDNVSFQYSSATKPALNNISFAVQKGETVAFVGPSGSGKTTIIKLIVGLYNAISGDVKIGNHSITTLDAAAYRNKIGFVSQDTQLFAGTIRDNMTFVKPEAPDSEILTVLKSASALSIIEKGDQGLDTKIGEGGLKLSGGEKQRLSIARALLRNPDLIIFDEATSSLDSLTEDEITQTIKEIKKDRPGMITILVAHRLSTVVHSDKIFVLEKGSVIEDGSHTELLKNSGLYFALWRQQVGI